MIGTDVMLDFDVSGTTTSRTEARYEAYLTSSQVSHFDNAIAIVHKVTYKSMPVSGSFTCAFGYKYGQTAEFGETTAPYSSINLVLAGNGIRPENKGTSVSYANTVSTGYTILSRTSDMCQLDYIVQNLIAHVTTSVLYLL